MRKSVDKTVWLKKSSNKVDLITFAETNAFVEIEGQTTYTLEGVKLVPGTRIIFANDYDTVVKTKINVSFDFSFDIGAHTRN